MSAEIIPDVELTSDVVVAETVEIAEPAVNYSEKSLAELVKLLEELVQNEDRMKLSKDAEAIKSAFYKRLQKDDLIYAIIDAEAIKTAQAAPEKPSKKRGRPKKNEEKSAAPVEQKEEIQKLYMQAIDRMFAVVRGADRENSLSKFKEKVNSMRQNSERRLRTEREKLYNRVRQLEQEVATLENNIGFFSKSKGAESLIAEVEEKIVKTKRDIADIVAKIKMIDDGE